MQNRTFAALAGEPNGFDTIRLLAAAAVIVSHGFVFTGQTDPLQSFTGQASIGTLAVAAFFVISGWLIPASYERGSLARFAARRARRILPALAVAVLVCAFVVGPAFTRLPLREYLLHGETWTFLGNAVFLPVGYELPGVFRNQPDHAVNGSLWSLKFELACYGFVPLALAMRRWQKPAVIAAWLASFGLARAIPADAGGLAFYIGTLAQLFRFFGAGMLLYLLADRVPLRQGGAWAGLAAVILAGFTPLFMEVAATAGAYALVVFAHRCGSGFRRITARGDISYGVYVYAFPIQQALVPASLGFALPWLANATLALPLAALAGLCSWRLIERPALRYRRLTTAAVRMPS